MEMEKEELRLDKLTQIGADKGLRVRYRPAYPFPLHAHEYYELEFIMEGTGKQWINGQEWPVARGAVSLLTPADFHEMQPEPGTILWNISFDESFLPLSVPEALLKGNYQPFHTVSEEILEKLDMAANLLLKESASDGLIRPLVEYILSLVIRNGEGSRGLSSMQKAILYVDTHFRENPSLSQAAEQACLSPVYFGSLFRKTTGKTYVQYLNFRKVECAKMLLASGVSVTEACYSAGFGSLSGFLHAFRQETGISPKLYKANLK